MGLYGREVHKRYIIQRICGPRIKDFHKVSGGMIFFMLLTVTFVLLGLTDFYMQYNFEN